MRTLITIVIAALSLNAFGQGIPQLPYNPDENGDGLIGVPDLQALLSQYGLEFNSAVLSEDAESAIVYMGEMAHPVCNLACDNLPGFWHMSTMDDLGLVWDDLSGTIWIKTPKFYTTLDLISGNTNMSGTYITNIHYVDFNNYGAQQSTSYVSSDRHCYCAAHELPKVEYSYCEGGNIQDCAANKVLEGWYPLGGISGNNQLNYTNTGYNTSSTQIRVQAFWRWAVE